MLTVDFDRLGLQPGDRVLDMGCGAGRHAFEMYRRGGDVVAFDQDGDELAGVLEIFGAMREQGRSARCRRRHRQGDALAMPFADEEFDRVVASKCSSTSPTARPSRSWCACCVPAAPSPSRCRAGCRRRSAGRCRTSTTRSRAATSASTPATSRRGEAAGGGVGVPRQGPRPQPALALLVDQVRRRRRQRQNPLVKACHQVLVWDIMDARWSTATRLAEQALNPLIGKSLVLCKPDAA